MSVVKSESTAIEMGVSLKRILIKTRPAHWRFTIDGFPFIDKQLVTRAMAQFATLKRGASLTLTSMFNRLHSVSFGSHRSETYDSYYKLYIKIIYL